MKHIILPIALIFCYLLPECSSHTPPIACSSVSDLGFSGYKGKIKTIIRTDSKAKNMNGILVQDTSAVYSTTIYNYDVEGALRTTLTTTPFSSDTAVTTYTTLANNIKLGISVENNIPITLDTTRWLDDYTYESVYYTVTVTGATQLSQYQKYTLDSNCLTQTAHTTWYNDDNTIKDKISYSADKNNKAENELRKKYGQLAFYYHAGNKVLHADPKENPSQILFQENDSTSFMTVIQYEYYDD